MRILFDHPWPLEATLTPQSMLKRFNDWIRERSNSEGARRLKIEPVRFIDSDTYSQMVDTMKHTSANAAIFRLLPDYVRTRSGGPAATLISGPNDLSESWRQALHSAMNDPADWRTPQIMAVAERRDVWPKTPEIDISIATDAPIQQRVFVILEEYERHRFALSDFDPWDLQRCHEGSDANRLTDFRCRLPKHPDLEGLPLGELQRKMVDLRRAGWHRRIKGKDWCYFFPREDWDVANISKEDWRNACKTFPRDSAARNKGSGPVDFWNRVWVWDRQKHTHWDVQFPTRNRDEEPDYCVVSHTGELIRDPDGACLATFVRT